PTLLVRLVPGFLATTRIALLASDHSGVLPAAPSLRNDPTNRGFSSHLLVASQRRSRARLPTPNPEPVHRMIRRYPPAPIPRCLRQSVCSPCPVHPEILDLLSPSVRGSLQTR